VLQQRRLRHLHREAERDQLIDLGRVCDPETLAEVKQELIRAFQLLTSQEQGLGELCKPWREAPKGTPGKAAGHGVKQ